jgi:hypothetical protein
MRADIAFEDGHPTQTIEFNYDAIDAYCFGVDKNAADSEAILEGFKKAFDWIADVKANDFEAIAVKVQTVRCILLGKNQVAMAKEIGVTRAAISQRMSELRDIFKLRQPTAGLRDNETRQKFSEQCKARHQKKKALLNSPNSPTTSTERLPTATASPSKRSVAAKPLFAQLSALARY